VLNRPPIAAVGGGHGGPLCRPGLTIPRLPSGVFQRIHGGPVRRLNLSHPATSVGGIPGGPERSRVSHVWRPDLE
jgi:hypothetical protein